jgi:hypothetical protein
VSTRTHISSLLGLNERCCCPFAVMLSFEDPTLRWSPLFCHPRGMAMLLFWCCPVLGTRTLTLAVFVVAYLPLNVSHCWAPLLFVWAVPSLLKGSSIIVALVPVSARPFLGSLLHFYHGLLRLFQRYASGLWKALRSFASTASKGSHCRYYCYCDSYACSRSTVLYRGYCPCCPCYYSFPCRSFCGLSGHLTLSGRRLLWTIRSYSTVLSFPFCYAFLGCCCGFLSFQGGFHQSGRLSLFSVSSQQSLLLCLPPQCSQSSLWLLHSPLLILLLFLLLGDPWPCSCSSLLRLRF